MPTSSPDLRQAVVDQAFRDAALHKALLDQLDEGIYFVDRDRRILYWNTSAERISGYLAHEVTGQYCHADLMSHCDSQGETQCHGCCPLTAVLQDGRPHKRTVFLRHRQGHRVPVDVQTRAIFDPSGAIIGAVEIFEEAVSPARNRIRTLQPFGCVDELTGAAHRSYGEMRVRHALQGLNEFGIPFGWLRVELDGAEQLIHSYGQGMLDAAVKMLSGTIDKNLAAFDILTRWDEAAFRIELHPWSHQALAEVAEKLVFLTRASNLDWWGDRLRVTVSVAAVDAQRGDTLESLEIRIAQIFESCRAGGGNHAAVGKLLGIEGPLCS